MDLIREREEIQGKIEAMVKHDFPTLTIPDQLTVCQKGTLTLAPLLTIQYLLDVLKWEHPHADL